MMMARRLCDRLLVLSICIFLLLSISAFAAKAATYSAIPAQVYEGLTTHLEISANNYNGAAEITTVQTVWNGILIHSIDDYDPWIETGGAGSSYADWTSGSLGTNVVDARFGVNATLPLVNQDTNQTIEITDDTGVSSTVITVLDDPTAPVFLFTIPSGGYLGRDSNQQTQAVVLDPETFVKEADFSYWDCSIGSAAKTEVDLTCDSLNPATCTNTFDTTPFSENDFVCFNFTAENYAGEISSLSGQFAIDETPPTVQILIPVNGSSVSATTQISYTVSDNLAPTLDCEIFIDDINALNRTGIANGTNDSFTLANLSLTEANHTLYVECVDIVGLRGQSNSVVYEIDVTAPDLFLINPNSASNYYIGDNQLITADATDLHGVDFIDYLGLDRDTSNQLEGNLTFNMSAQDTVGNFGTETFTIIVDKTAPSIILHAPIANAEVDGNHIEVNFTPTDNLGVIANCNASLSTGESTSNNATFGQVSTFVITGASLGFTNLTVTCYDEAGNRGASNTLEIEVVDRSGPVIVSAIDFMMRGMENVVQVNITDVSGVDAATTFLRSFGNVYTLAFLGNDIYQAVIVPDSNLALGTYAANSTASDTLGFSSEFIDNFILEYGLDIEFTLTPNPVAPSTSYTISGSVTYDNGSSTNESEVIIFLPDGSNASVDLINDDFSLTDISPSTTGAYDVTVRVPSENGYSYSLTEILTVQTAGRGQSGGGGERESPFSSVIKGPRQNSEPSQAPAPINPSFSGQDDSNTPNTDTGNTPPPANVQSGEDSSLRDASPNTGTGVGSASNVFNLSMLAGKWWILLLLVAGVGGLFALAYYQKGSDEEENSPPQQKE